MPIGFEEDWKNIVLIATIVIAIFVFFKILFVIGIIMIVIGVGLSIAILLGDEDSSYAIVPIILILVGLVLASVSHYIIYQFEETPTGKALVDTAEDIIEIDQEIKSIPNEIIDDVINQSLP